jgi:hypothetical protein
MLDICVESSYHYIKNANVEWLTFTKTRKAPAKLTQPFLQGQLPIFLAIFGRTTCLTPQISSTTIRLYNDSQSKVKASVTGYFASDAP